MRRRVLFVTQTAHVWGGLEVWLDEIVPWLRNHSWDPVVALARGHRYNDPDAYRRAHPHFATIEVDGRWGTRESRVAAIRTAIRSVKPDLVVPINIADTIEAVAREKIEGSAVRLLVMLRAIQPHGELEDLRRWRDFVDIAVGGNRLRRDLIAAWTELPERRLRYIPTGARRKTSATRVARGERLRLAYVGRLEEKEKRATDLIAVADALDRQGVGYELRIAGDGPARSTMEAALRGRARFLGKISVDELYSTLFPSTDALLLFSTAEAGPQVVWQAMHYGVVPVVSEYRGLRAERVLREGETALLFPVGDAEAAARQVARLARDPQLLAGIAGRAEKVIDPDYLLEHAFGEWLRAFEDACSLPRALSSELPPLKSSGWPERLGLPSALAHVLRRILGRAPEPRDSGDEWPHHGGIDEGTFKRIEDLSLSLDR